MRLVTNQNPKVYLKSHYFKNFEFITRYLKVSVYFFSKVWLIIEHYNMYLLLKVNLPTKKKKKERKKKRKEIKFKIDKPYCCYKFYFYKYFD